ncbi:MAG: ATP-binding cassette domain-containing protein [Planctomycetota bacterium]
MIELDNISKNYGELQVLKPTSISIEEGKTVVMIGPSGCGKSTLLRILIGLIEPDSGSVRFRGETMTPSNVLKMRHSMGYVLQDGGLFPHLTVEANVTLLARHLGSMSDADMKSRVAELAALTKLPEEALDRFPNQISGGQRQRVAIMRALMLDPPLLLLDEPMGALDPLVRYDLQEDLKEIFQRLKKTVVLVTHDMGEAGFFGEDVMLMFGGKIVQRGTLNDFVERPADDFVAKFITAQRIPELSSD